MRVIFLLMALFASDAFAAQRTHAVHHKPGMKGMCFAKAAKEAGVDRDLLIAMGMHESGLNPRVIHANKDGTYDIGVMQVNSSHLPLLKLAGINERDLYVPCINVMTGAMFLKQSIRVEGNTWRAVGSYNTGFRKSRDEAREQYVAAVKQIYYRLKLQRRMG